MIDNIDIAYCMAQLENRIRREWISAKNYLDYCDGNVEDPVYERANNETPQHERIRQ